MCLQIGNNPFTPDVATVILKAITKAENSDIKDLDMEVSCGHQHHMRSHVKDDDESEPRYIFISLSEFTIAQSVA